MTMTAREVLGKQQIQRHLSEQGYPTYADLFGYFQFNITKDPGVIGYMIPDKGIIVVNADHDMDEISVIVRHEILHEYLTHELRLLKNYAKRKNLDYDKLTDMSIEELDDEMNNIRKGDYSLGNWAGDYEISNRGYTDEDKEIIRQLHGLVTEDEHPDWADLSVEELFDELMKEREKDQQQGKGQNGKNKDKNGQGQGGDGEGDDQPFDADQVQPQQGGGSGGGSKGKSAGTTIIKGTFKNGKFYGLDGKVIKH